MRSLFVFLLLAFAAPASAAPNVVATIKPLHSLVSMVMGEVGTPTLLVRGVASPHAYSLRPSDAAALASADLVFWTGHGMEVFLEDKLDTLAPTARRIDMSATPGLVLLPLRQGGSFEPHDDGDPAEAGHDGHDDERDMHFFLDPDNARLMVKAIADALSAADPSNAAAYAANAQKADAALQALGSTLAARLVPLAGRPFVVFHDAYQYFEKRFNMSAAGSITVSPEVAPGAERVRQIRDKLKTLRAACVFAEPQFDRSRIAVFLESTGARDGVLDPEGAALEEGPGLYAKLLTGLADSLSTCLSAAGP